LGTWHDSFLPTEGPRPRSAVGSLSEGTLLGDGCWSWLETSSPYNCLRKRKRLAAPRLVSCRSRFASGGKKKGDNGASRRGRGANNFLFPQVAQIGTLFSFVDLTLIFLIFVYSGWRVIWSCREREFRFWQVQRSFIVLYLV